LFQRRPVLPGHPKRTVFDRTALASGKRGGDESPRCPLSRAAALQSRRDERLRRRRISPRRLSGGPRQAALPGKGGLHGTFLLPPSGPRPCFAPATVLCTKDDHRPNNGQREDRPEAL